MYLPDFTPHSTWQFREHSQEETMLPTAWGGCLQPSTLAGFEFHSLFGTYLGPAPPSQLADGQSSLPGRCKVQTVLPSTGHTALFSEQMFQHLPRCLSAASRNVLVSQLLRAPSAGTPCRGQVRHTPPSVHARI